MGHRMSDRVSTFTQRAAPVLQWTALAIALAFVATLAGLGPAVAIAPLAAILVVTFAVVTPLRYSAMALLAVALLVDNPGERPMDVRWRSPLLPIGEALYLNLHKLTGIDLLRFSALELALAAIALLLLYRKWTGDRIDDPLRLGALPNPMRSACAAMVAALLAMEVYGLARGGDFKNSLWQIRQLMWLPLIGVMMGNAIKTDRARRWLLRIVVVVACLRALLGVYVYVAIIRPSGQQAEYVLTHSDAILAVTAMLVAVMLVVARPCVEHVVLNLVAQPILLAGLIVNDRRIAFVSLAAGLCTIVLLSPPELKRLMRRLVLLSIPFALIYTAVGWNSSASLFKPVGILRSVTEQEDASSQTRDIENFNLIQTLKQHPIIGAGFGHEYYEKVQANRVDQIFAQYKFVAHNSVLWFLAIGGAVGFAVVWTFFGMAVSVSMIVLNVATASTDRAVALGTVAVVLSFTIQAWGDMGFQSWMGILLLGSFVGATGSLASALQHGQHIAGAPRSRVTS